MKSRIQDDKNVCARCGCHCEHPDKHHIFNGLAYRDKSEEDGLFVHMHHQCHMLTHSDPTAMRKWKEKGQLKYEAQIGTREEFMERYGKSYL